MTDKINGSVTYEIIGEIASGGMGSVYKAKLKGVEGFEKIVAIKTILNKHAEDKKFIERFVFEAKLVATLVHENIVQIYQLDKTDDTYFFVQEYVDGINLHDFIKFHKIVKERLPVELAVFIASRIARGLAYAHSRYSPEGQPLNIIHCDICPRNVLINREGVTKITDFGIAKAATMQDSGRISGKFAFMSPEQYSDPASMTGQSDVYSLGVVLFLLLSFRYTRDVDLKREDMIKQIKENYINWSALPDDLPSKLREILEKMLATDPAARFSSSAALAEELERYIYHDHYGPTIVTLANYLRKLMPGRFSDPLPGRDYQKTQRIPLVSVDKTVIL